MSDALRPRRSVLYMPAANERALEKAQNFRMLMVTEKMRSEKKIAEPEDI